MNIYITSILSLFFVFSIVANAEEKVVDDIINIVIRDHKFEPAEVQIPADKKVKLKVKNLDATPEEFESHDLKREKVISGNGEATISIGPLKPGQYKFEGEFNPKTAQGIIIVK